MLTAERLQQILDRLRDLSVAVLGDLFLDRYLDIDASLVEESVETGLPAHQVFAVRSEPGAAGTILNNLVALGVGRVLVMSVVGDDGEGYELTHALKQKGVELRYLLETGMRRTPTYMKPIVHEAGRMPRELSRLDVRTRAPMPSSLTEQICDTLPKMFAEVDALIVQDQMPEADRGVVTAPVREQLAQLGREYRDKPILADSRRRIGQFRGVRLKPNESECRAAFGDNQSATLSELAKELAGRCGRTVFCTQGEKGMIVADPEHGADSIRVPAVQVAGPIDPVGAGDSVNAAIAAALAADASSIEAAAFANLVASITIRQIGCTGTATPMQIVECYRAVADQYGGR